MKNFSNRNLSFRNLRRLIISEIFRHWEGYDFVDIHPLHKRRGLRRVPILKEIM